MKKPTVQASVVFLQNQEKEICLAQKKQPIHHDNGEIGYSLLTWNGYGGKKENEDLTIEDTAIRELFQETGGVIGKKEHLTIVSRVYFYLVKDGIPSPFMSVSFFVLSLWEGDPVETTEMGPPTFFKESEVPYNNMMPADKYLLTEMFKGRSGVYEVLLYGKNTAPSIREIKEEL